jgi:hypothetical protein
MAICGVTAGMATASAPPAARLVDEAREIGAHLVELALANETLAAYRRRHG